MEHIRSGKHGAQSTKQAIAIGLSKARRAGVDLKAPKIGLASDKTRASAERDYSKGHSAKKGTSSRRSRATLSALKHEPKTAASHQALSRQGRSAARKRKRSGTTTAGPSRRAGSVGDKTILHCLLSFMGWCTVSSVKNTAASFPGRHPAY
jgi:Family of unknown function (DUF6496)